jgi:hypothetical protein
MVSSSDNVPVTEHYPNVSIGRQAYGVAPVQTYGFRWQVAAAQQRTSALGHPPPEPRNQGAVAAKLCGPKGQGRITRIHI